MTEGLRIEHRAGEKTVFQSDAPRGGFSVVFEDDGETGYFYGVDLAREGSANNPIVDALHLYNVDDVADRVSVYSVEIRWAENRNRAGLFIAERCQAVFDFDEKRAVCRSGFPAPSGEFTSSHEWDDSLTAGF